MKIVTNCHQTMIKSYCWVSFMSVFHSTIRSNQIIKFGWIFHNFLSLLRKAPPHYQSTKLVNWKQSILNHLYWCAASSHGDGEQVKAKWLSILKHVMNIHQGHSETFPECAHGPLEEEREWLRRGNASQE